jgi:predicted DNA-binding transcriptional regulator AlpA
MLIGIAITRLEDQQNEIPITRVGGSGGADRAFCALFGGIAPATLYRHVRNGVVPRPVKVGALSRWLKSECLAALEAMVGARS